MRKRRSEEDILEEALALFIERGYVKTRLTDIADKLNMTNSNLYCYFDNKEAIYKASIAFAMEKWISSCDEYVVSLGDTANTMRNLVIYSLKYLENNYSLFEILKDAHFNVDIEKKCVEAQNVKSSAKNLVVKCINKEVKMQSYRKCNVDCIANVLLDLFAVVLVRAYYKNSLQEAPNMACEHLKVLESGLRIN